MRNPFLFNKSVQGYNHLIHDPILPCEDSSEVYCDPTNRFFIAVVADGHGDSSCPRSAFGSQAVVKVSIEKLKEFAERIMHLDTNEQYRMLSVPKNRDQQIRQLTDEIIDSWQRTIHEDLINNPLKEEELDICGKYADRYRNGERLEHIYGTTLIAALQLPEYLVLLQQGDGRCDVFYSDGTIEQPIPWDDRCFENVVTSMCDQDVATSIRHKVINLDEQPVIACYMASDGVEDSYPYEPMEGTHTFFRELCIKIVEDGTNDFEQYLEEYLPVFSQSGSGDDISVAGIVNVSSISSLTEEYKRKTFQYKLIDKKVYFESKLNSMKRKHGILLERKDAAENELEAIKNRIIALEDEIQQTTKEVDRAQTKVEELKRSLDDKTDLNECLQEEENSTIPSLFQKLNQKMEGLAKCLHDGIVSALDQSQREYQEAVTCFQTKQEKLEALHQERMALESELQSCEEKRKKSYEEYSEYDDKYRQIEMQLQEIIQQMSNFG